MNNLKSEILFNRALLWLVLAGLTREYQTMRVAYGMLVVYNIWESFKAWED